MLTHTLHRTATCLICDAPLTWNQTRNHQLCDRNECAWRYSLLQKQNKLCRICRRPLSDQYWASGLCSAPECQRAALVQRANEDHQQRMQRERQLRKQAEQIRDQVVKRFGVRQAESFLIAVIPAATHRISRLSGQRRREFRDYLKSLIERAAARPPLPPEPIQEMSAEDARLQAASGNACACCQGSCCRGGFHTHAYLGVETLQRYMAAHPAQSPRKVLASYMRHIGDETCENSCIYHQANGCSLPREMRAAICNHFYCSGLREFQAHVPKTGAVRGFFVAADAAVIQRAALVDEEQMLLLPAPPADAD